MAAMFYFSCLILRDFSYLPSSQAFVCSRTSVFTKTLSPRFLFLYHSISKHSTKRHCLKAVCHLFQNHVKFERLLVGNTVNLAMGSTDSQKGQWEITQNIQEQTSKIMVRHRKSIIWHSIEYERQLCAVRQLVEGSRTFDYTRL